jgi:hypothetical protein
MTWRLPNPAQLFATLALCQGSDRAMSFVTASASSGRGPFAIAHGLLLGVLDSPWAVAKWSCDFVDTACGLWPFSVDVRRWHGQCSQGFRHSTSQSSLEGPMSFDFKPQSDSASTWDSPQPAAPGAQLLWNRPRESVADAGGEASSARGSSSPAEIAAACRSLFEHLAEPPSSREKLPVDLAEGPAAADDVARQGLAGSGQAMPHFDTLQRAFAGFDLSGISAFVGGAAAQASDRLGALAYARGDSVAFGAQPDLFTAAHEVAHIIDQRAGSRPTSGMGEDNDHHEQRADQIAARVVGNQPIAELLPHPMHTPSMVGASGHAVQLRRKSRDKDAQDLTCSDSGQTLLASDQELYATPQHIAQGNAKLAQAGKHGSFIKLTAGAAKKHEKQSLVKVVPTWSAKGKDVGEHGKPEKANEDGGPLDIWADCGRSAGAVTGASGPGHADRSIVYKAGGKEKTTKGRHDDGLHRNAQDNLPGLGANAVYFDAMPPFLQNPKNRRFLVEGVHYTKDPKTQKIDYILPKDGLEAQALYGALTEDGKDAFDRRAGINNYANPGIGEAYTMASGYDLPGFSTAGRSVWNFHFAGVIMKDGADNITLENYAVGNREAVNSRWNFALYGTTHSDGSVDKDETFHHDHLNSGTHGTQATTLRVRTDK